MTPDWKGLLRRWGWAVLVAACFLAFLGDGLNEPDEGRYGEIGREMAMGDSWLIPHLNGIPHFQKPPLLYWFTALSIKTFGVHAWAARLPAVAAALATLAVTAWIAQMLFGEGMRQAAVLTLASSAGFFAVARLLTPDMLLTFWITLAIACVVRRYHGGDRRWGFAFFVAMGLGFLSKGPMALVVPISAALGLRWATPKISRPAIPWAVGLPITLALGLSWFVALSMSHRELFHYFAGYELVQRFTSGAHGRSKPFWFFLVVLPVAFIPWTFWLPSIFRDIWRRWRSGTLCEPSYGLILGWIVPPFLILSCSGSKLPTYILPLLPAFTLAVLVWWRDHSARTVWLHRMAATMLGLLVILASLRDFADPLLKQQSDTDDLAEIAKKQPDFEQATLFAARVRAQGFTFATGRLLCVTEDEADVVLKPTPEQQARLFPDIHHLEKAMVELPTAYGIARREDVPKVFGPRHWRELGAEGDFVLVGRLPKGP